MKKIVKAFLISLPLVFLACKNDHPFYEQEKEYTLSYEKFSHPYGPWPADSSIWKSEDIETKIEREFYTEKLKGTIEKVQKKIIPVTWHPSGAPFDVPVTMEYKILTINGKEYIDVTDKKRTACTDIDANIVLPKFKTLTNIESTIAKYFSYNKSTSTRDSIAFIDGIIFDSTSVNKRYLNMFFPMKKGSITYESKNIRVRVDNTKIIDSHHNKHNK